ncbi:enoyl-CoA hydratase-related protein [Paraburkholderia sediminicola]|uniref:Enoyl-CoA hydratase-related protein n=1 Tax=Paraburkholderia metrosideri TaxID=580937 RepID=A0ABW9E6J4_9BURK
MNVDTSIDPVTLGFPEQHIAVVTLRRAEKRNAINGHMTRLLAEIGAELESNDDVRVVILTSSSDTFCAGADLGEVAAGGKDNLSTPLGGFAGFVRAPKSKPWIAAMDGHALAGGLEIALACHMRVAGRNACFGLPEPRYGMLAAAGGLDRLPRLIPRAIAIEMLCTGEAVDARRAYELGLVNHVVESGLATDKAMEIARSICRNAPLAVRASLALAQLADELGASALVDQVKVKQSELYGSVDFTEGTRAFVEKRQPRWEGR